MKKRLSGKLYFGSAFTKQFLPSYHLPGNSATYLSAYLHVEARTPKYCGL
jgi:hypothetical protein